MRGARLSLALLAALGGCLAAPAFGDAIGLTPEQANGLEALVRTCGTDPDDDGLSTAAGRAHPAAGAAVGLVNRLRGRNAQRVHRAWNAHVACITRAIHDDAAEQEREAEEAARAVVQRCQRTCAPTGEWQEYCAAPGVPPLPLCPKG